MSEHKGIYVPLGKDLIAALQQSAQSSYRHPRDEARFLLRQALLGTVTEMTTTPQTQPEPAAAVAGQS
jgi:hypothetical protein